MLPWFLLTSVLVNVVRFKEASLFKGEKVNNWTQIVSGESSSIFLSLLKAICSKEAN